MTTPDTSLLLDLAVRVARAAGAELLSRYGRIEGLDTKSSATDPVSDADRASEALMVRMLLAERPDDGLIGEEGASRASASGITWVIDPLDGTVNYLYELDSFSVSIAAEDAEGGLVGAVFDPVMDRIYTAVRGGGAFADGRPLHANEPVALDRALLGTGFGYSAERRAAQGAIIARLLPAIRDIRRFGSAALNLLRGRCRQAGRLLLGRGPALGCRGRGADRDRGGRADDGDLADRCADRLAGGRSEPARRPEHCPARLTGLCFLPAQEKVASEQSCGRPPDIPRRMAAARWSGVPWVATSGLLLMSVMSCFATT